MTDPSRLARSKPQQAKRPQSRTTPIPNPENNAAEANAASQNNARSKAPMRNYAIFLAAVLAIGAAAGAFVWAFLFTMNTCLSLIWDILPNKLGIPCFPLIMCTVGGIIIGLCQKRYAGLPEDMMSVLGQVKRTGSYDAEKVKPAALCALLPLVFGGSVGPEAGLVGVIAGLCTNIGAKLRHLGSEFRELAAAGTAASLSAIFGAPLFAIAAPLEGDNAEKQNCTAGNSGSTEKAKTTEKHTARNAAPTGTDAANTTAQVSKTEEAPATSSNKRFPKWLRVCAYALAAAGAFGTMALLNGITGAGAGLPRFTSISFGNGEATAAAAALICGAAAGWLFHAGEHVTHKLASKLGERPVTKAVIAGVVLGACGTALPLTMFAGEAQIHELMETWTLLSGSVLIATGFVKVLVTPLCVNFGWRGGHFFPVIFAGVAIGYGFAIVFGVNPVLAAATGAGAVVGGVMRKPVLAMLLLFLCFPITAAPILLAAAFIARIIPLPKAWQHKQPTLK